MKKFLISLIVLIYCVSSQAQTFNDIFNDQTEIVWLGLDFTKTKVIGDKESWVNREPLDLFEAWNQLMINEADKYNVAVALHKNKVKPALEVTMAHNKNLSTEDIFVTSYLPEYKLSTEAIQGVVNTYDFSGYSGIGFMIIIESFDKPAQRASMCVTFINLNTKEVLFAQRLTNSPSGFGLRNYWASTVYSILKKIRSTEYRKWMKSYRKPE